MATGSRQGGRRATAGGKAAPATTRTRATAKPQPAATAAEKQPGPPGGARAAARSAERAGVEAQAPEQKAPELGASGERAASAQTAPKAGGTRTSIPGFDALAGLAEGAGSQQLVEAMTRNMQLALQIAEATLAGAERMRQIQLGAAKSAHAKATTLQGAVGGAGNAGQLWGAEQQMLLENVQQAIAYWNQMLEAAASTNAAIARILGGGFGEISAQGKSMARQVERALGSMPGIGSSLASADWMPAVTAANAAYRDLWSSTTKMIEQLQGNLKAFGAVARGGFGRGGPSG